MINTSKTSSQINNQRGIVLVFSLLILSVLTLVALTGMKSSIVDEKMSGNLRDSELALQAAESALRDAETFINNITSVNDLTNANGLLKEGNDGAAIEPDYLDNSVWEDSSPSNYTETTYVGGNQFLARQPRYIIKYMGDQDVCTGGSKPYDQSSAANTNLCDRAVFRATAHGTGLSADTNKILQAFFERDTFK